MAYRKKIYILITLFISVIFIHTSAYAEETYQELEEELKEYDLSQIDSVLESNNLNFSDMVKRLATGQSEGVFFELLETITNNIFSDVIYNKGEIVKIIIIAIASSLFSNISLILNKSEMSETAFYITYIMLVTVLTGSFFVMSDMVEQVLKNTVLFMNALVPAFFISVGVASGTFTAVGFAKIVLLGIAIVEKLILGFVIPAIKVYVILMLVNNMLSEDYFSKFADVIKTFINWAMKGVVTVLMGANIIQGMILPSVDQAKTGIINKIVNIIPGGTGMTAISSVMSATGSVIKNAIGAAGLIGLCTICLLPIIKMLIYTGMYKLTGAVIQPISDKRIGKSVDVISAGIGLLYRSILTLAFLIFITIAIVCFSTNYKG